jgi:hypothetical protein
MIAWVHTSFEAVSRSCTWQLHWLGRVLVGRMHDDGTKPDDPQANSFSGAREPVAGVRLNETLISECRLCKTIVQHGRQQASRLQNHIISIIYADREVFLS